MTRWQSNPTGDAGRRREPRKGLSVEVTTGGDAAEQATSGTSGFPSWASDAGYARTGHTHGPNFGRIVAGCPRCAELAAGAEPVSWNTQADRGRWKRASSLAEVGELTAAWLTGQIASQPGYYGPVDVDEDLAPGLTGALVAVNRAGAVTTGSQAGLDDAAGEGWVQLAWVDAFVDDAGLARLRAAAAGTDYQYQVIVHAPHGDPVPVTWVRGEVCTSTGWIESWEVAWLYQGVGRGALEQVLTAHQVSVIDPVPGRNTMWAWLEQAVQAGPPVNGQVVGR